MQLFSLSKHVPQALNFTRNSNRHLAPSSSPTSSAPRLLVFVAASLLVIASAGFGAMFAWSTGSKHSIALGVLSVAMAVGLETSKPFAIAGAFSALREWKVIQAGALGLAGLLAVGYSLQAELTFMAMTRGDLVAERTGEADAGKKAANRYRIAETELNGLAPSRPVAAVEAEISGLLLRPGVDGCKEINGPVTKEACPRIAELREEAARAQRRAELLADMRSAEADQKAAPAVSAPDPGAAALSAYLESAGVLVSPEKLGIWLPLLGVLALEIGAAMAVLLYQTVAPRDTTPPVESAVSVSQRPAEAAPSGTREKRSKSKRKDDEPPAPGTPLQTKRGLEALLSSYANNGAKASQRELAKALGCGKSSINRMLHRLHEAGEIVLETSKEGTVFAAA